MLDRAKSSGDSQSSAAEHYTELAALAGGLAHEIKNPLSTIRLNMELLAEDFAESPALRDRRALAKIQVLQAQAFRLDKLNLRQRSPVAQRRRLGKILGQQLHVEPNGRERVLDLVRQAPGQRRQLGIVLGRTGL
jgi:nitrogen-specific signal transduction histidine kinase